MPGTKIKDRFLLGAVAGLTGTAVKYIVSAAFRKAKWLDVGGPEKAAGMIIPAHQVAQPLGKVVGYFGDAVISGFGGLIVVYTLSVTGTNAAVLKGAMMGQAIWTFMYGALSQAGVTKVPTISAKTAIAEMVSHTVYGAVVGGLATALAAPDVYRQPLSSSPSYVTDSPQASALTAERFGRPQGSRTKIRVCTTRPRSL